MEQTTQDVRLIIKPRVQSDKASEIEVTVILPCAHYHAGDEFDSLPCSIASCPCANYDDTSIQAWDAQGEVGLVPERTMGPLGPQNSYIFSRDTQGVLTIHYSHPIPAYNIYSRDPGMHLCRHDFGITGAGCTFLLLPEGHHRFHVDINVSQYSSGAYGMAGNKTGSFVCDCEASYLKNIYYAAGHLREFRRPQSQLHIFTLDEDTRYFEQLFEIFSDYFDFMASFFNDTDEAYHIILYPLKRCLLSGTAMQRCVYMGFDANHIVNDLSEVEDVLGHEFTHNWCLLGAEHPEQEALNVLFTEGIAEYYGAAMLHRTGRHGLDTWVNSVNAKLRDYYSNPWREVPYKDVYPKAWTHSFAQLISYNLGIMALMHIDSMIRAHSCGSKSLDDLIRQIIALNRGDKPADWDTFVSLSDELTGNEASAKINAILEGGLCAPPEDYFAPEYKLIQTTVHVSEEGFDPTVRYMPEKRIFGLVEGSNAQKAGLRNGDLIIKYINVTKVGEELPITHCLVERNGEELAFDYVAYGDEVSCLQYVKA